MVYRNHYDNSEHIAIQQESSIMESSKRKKCQVKPVFSASKRAKQHQVETSCMVPMVFLSCMFIDFLHAELSCGSFVAHGEENTKRFCLFFQKKSFQTSYSRWKLVCIYIYNIYTKVDTLKIPWVCNKQVLFLTYSGLILRGKSPSPKPPRLPGPFFLRLGDSKP